VCHEPAKDGFEIVAAPSSGWCDPAADTCSIVADDRALTVEASNENAAGDVPGAAQR
jgi:hypothetical protein